MTVCGCRSIARNRRSRCSCIGRGPSPRVVLKSQKRRGTRTAATPCAQWLRELLSTCMPFPPRRLPAAASCCPPLRCTSCRSSGTIQGYGGCCRSTWWHCCRPATSTLTCWHWRCPRRSAWTCCASARGSGDGQSVSEQERKEQRLGSGSGRKERKRRRPRSGGAPGYGDARRLQVQVHVRCAVLRKHDRNPGHDPDRGLPPALDPVPARARVHDHGRVHDRGHDRASTMTRTGNAAAASTQPLAAAAGAQGGGRHHDDIGQQGPPSRLLRFRWMSLRASLRASL